jgi:site-specific DNA recombinase
MKKLSHEKTALQATLQAKVETTVTLFDLTEKLLANALRVWNFADEQQKRKIIQSLISKITLTGDDIKIEWAVH